MKKANWTLFLWLDVIILYEELHSMHIAQWPRAHGACTDGSEAIQ